MEQDIHRHLEADLILFTPLQQRIYALRHGLKGERTHSDQEIIELLKLTPDQLSDEKYLMYEKVMQNEHDKRFRK